MDENNKIRKRDLIFGFIITDLIAVIVLVIVWRGGGNAQIVNQFSLGASISSIFLALVAIIYAFFQSNASSNQNTLVHIALNKIIDRVEEFSLIKEEIESFRESSKSDISNIFSAIENLGSKSIEKSLKGQEVDIPEIVQEAISKYENDMRIGLTSLEEKISKLNTDSSNTSRRTKKSPQLIMSIHFDPNLGDATIFEFIRTRYPFITIYSSSDHSLELSVPINLADKLIETLKDEFDGKIISISRTIMA